jgi:hypothetical protein
MTLTLDYPILALPPTDVSLAAGYASRPGQQATNGMQRSVGIASGQFRLTMTVNVYNEQRVRAARAFFWNMEADTQLVRIRLPDLYGLDGPFAQASAASRKANVKGIPFASEAMFAAGIGHAVPTLETTFARAAVLNDREIYVNADAELPAGCAISIDEFCHGIAGSWTEEDGSNRIRLSPVLRKAAAIDDVVSLAPVFVGFCVTESPGYEAMALGQYGTHTIEFVEDLARLVESTD